MQTLDIAESNCDVNIKKLESWSRPQERKWFKEITSCHSPLGFLFSFHLVEKGEMQEEEEKHWNQRLRADHTEQD